MSVLQIRPATLEDAPEVAALQVSSWQMAYAGMMPEEYLAQLSVETRAQRWRDTLTSGTSSLVLAREVEQAPADAPLDGRVPPPACRAVGFVSFGKCRDRDAPDTWGEIWAIYVLPSHWSRGVGHALFRHACGHLRQQGFRHVSLWVLADNERAIGFYRRAGLVPDTASAQSVTIGGRSLAELRYHCDLP